MQGARKRARRFQMWRWHGLQRWDLHRLHARTVLRARERLPRRRPRVFDERADLHRNGNASGGRKPVRRRSSLQSRRSLHGLRASRRLRCRRPLQGRPPRLHKWRGNLQGRRRRTQRQELRYGQGLQCWRLRALRAGQQVSPGHPHLRQRHSRVRRLRPGRLEWNRLWGESLLQQRSVRRLHPRCCLHGG